MRVTTWTEYSLIISTHLARRMATGLPVAAREMAEAERLPPDYVEQILLRLRRAGLVDSVRGAKGGYRLTRPAATISVYDVMRASDHQTFEVNCQDHRIDRERCDPTNACSVRPVWQAVQERVNKVLKGVSLADLLKQEPEVAQIVGLGKPA